RLAVLRRATPGVSAPVTDVRKESRHRIEGKSEVMLEGITIRISVSAVLRLLFQAPPHQGASTVDSPGSRDRRWARLRCRSRHGGKLEKPSGRAERHCHNHK